MKAIDQFKKLSQTTNPKLNASSIITPLDFRFLSEIYSFTYVASVFSTFDMAKELVSKADSMNKQYNLIIVN